MKTRVFNGKEQIFCEWRHRWVRLTPEEWIRQQLLHRLVEQLAYPASLIAVEVPLEKISCISSQLHTRKRCDAVVYNRQMQPLMLIECKADTVPLTQRTLDQAVTYNRRLGVPYLLLHNGLQSIVVYLNNTTTEGTLTFRSQIPDYNSVLGS